MTTSWSVTWCNWAHKYVLQSEKTLKYCVLKVVKGMYSCSVNHLCASLLVDECLRWKCRLFYTLQLNFLGPLHHRATLLFRFLYLGLCNVLSTMTTPCLLKSKHAVVPVFWLVVEVRSKTLSQQGTLEMILHHLPPFLSTSISIHHTHCETQHINHRFTHLCR